VCSWSRSVECVEELTISRLHPSIPLIVERTITKKISSYWCWDRHWSFRILHDGIDILTIDCCHERNFFPSRFLELGRWLFYLSIIALKEGTRSPKFFWWIERRDWLEGTMTGRSQTCIDLLEMNGKLNHWLSIPFFLAHLSDVIGREHYDRPFANMHEKNKARVRVS
jgi:hypothetical protein